LFQYFLKLLKLNQNLNFKASCLRQVDVYGNKSLDEDGRERFHPINIKRCFEGDYGGWFESCTINKLKNVIEIESCRRSFYFKFILIMSLKIHFIN